MTETNRPFLLYGIVALLFVGTWYLLGLNSALFTLNLCLISAVMALGVNIQWGYAGLFNVGIMGFTAIGGLCAVLISYRPIAETWEAGGTGILISGLLTAHCRCHLHIHLPHHGKGRSQVLGPDDCDCRFLFHHPPFLCPGRRCH